MKLLCRDVVYWLVLGASVECCAWVGVAWCQLHAVTPHACAADGKTVLLVGINGPLGSSLQCLLQRRGAITASCHWKSSGLQSKVRPLFWHLSDTEPYKLPKEVIFPLL